MEHSHFFMCAHLQGARRYAYILRGVYLSVQYCSCVWSKALILLIRRGCLRPEGARHDYEPRRGDPPQLRATPCESRTGHSLKPWDRDVEGPAKRAGLAAPRLVVLPSPYRFVITPMLDYILELERSNPGRQIAVLIPELVEC